MTRSGQNRDICLRDLLFDDIRHRIECALFDALRHGYDNLTLADIRLHLMRRRTHEDGRHRQHDELLILQCSLQIRAEAHTLRNHGTRQILMTVGLLKRIHLLLKLRPDGHLMSVMGEQNAEGRTPGTCADD